MFLNLIASCLLSVAVGTSSVFVEEHKEVQVQEYLDSPRNALYGSDYLYQQYVFKYWDTQYDTPFYTESLFDDNVSINIDSNIDNDYYSPLVATNYSTSNNSYIYGDLIAPNNFFMNYSADTDTISISVTFGSSTFNFYFGINDEVIYSDNLDQTIFCVYFIDYYSLNDNQLKLFFTVFTSYFDETLFTNYTGWYHMSDRFLTSNYLYYSVMGSMLYGNKFYNLMSCIRVNNPGVVVLGSIDFTYMSNGYKTDLTAYPVYTSDVAHFSEYQSNVMMSGCFMTQDTYDKLTLYGAFDYVPNDIEYGLDDLFISIADTPIQFVTGLFSFELFGTTFSVAVLGILTVMCIIFIIRKVV